MDTEFTYYAFISYSHKDKAFAQKLHRYLEHYKLPSVLCRKFPHVPKKLRPVFIDYEDLGINELSEAIKEALAVSRYLIVICSENSIKPNEEGKNWVEEELHTFLSLRTENAKHVIPIILRKEGGLPAHACLLPAIRERDIKGADVLTQGRERVCSDVIAKMTGLRSDTLWDRYQREQRRKRRMRWLGGMAAALCSAAAGWWCWDYYVPHVSYYTDYIERDNVPEGLFELTEEQMKARHRHYRFTRHKHLLQTVEYCNSAGTVQEHAKHWHRERPAGMAMEYDGEKNALHCIHRNAQGKETTVRKFSPGCIDFVQNSGGIEVKQSVSFVAGIGGNERETLGQKADIGRLVVRRSQAAPGWGVVEQELYRKFGTDTPVRDAQGLSGRSYELDALGRPIVVRYLREMESGEVEPMETQKGIAGYRLDYGENGHITTATFINKEGKPALHEEQWAKVKMEYDTQGNLLKKSYYGVDGQPRLHKDGYARVEYRYDTRGNREQELCYGLDGALCTNAHGYARRTWTYNEQGNPMEETYLTPEGTPCLHTDGYARITFKYDNRGNKEEEAFFTADGSSCLHKDGYARMTCRYDAKGNKEEAAYFGTDDKPLLHKDGFARVAWTYDPRGRGNATEEAYFGEDGKPCLDKDMVARVVARYDERGNSIGQEYYGVDGKPCFHKDGVAQLEVRYDGQGNRIEQKYFDTEGAPCCHRDGNASVTWTYDKRGNWIEKNYYGKDGRLCLLKAGYASIRCRYDARGNKVEEAYFGVDGQPCNKEGGCARITWVYDDRGNEAMVIKHNAEGREISRDVK